MCSLRKSPSLSAAPPIFGFPPGATLKIETFCKTQILVLLAVVVPLGSRSRRFAGQRKPRRIVTFNPCRPFPHIIWSPVWAVSLASPLIWRQLFHGNFVCGPVQPSVILAGSRNPPHGRGGAPPAVGTGCRCVASRLNFKPLPHACFPVRAFRLGLAEPRGMKIAAHRLDLRSPVSLYGQQRLIRQKVFWIYKKI